jgi:uncharacterized protein
MKKIAFEKARQFALERLEHDLSPRFLYHSLVHTRDDVVPATERLAIRSKISGTDLALLLTAAYFHDLGFTRLADVDPRGNQHELISAQFAREVLPSFGFHDNHVEAICSMIMATRLPQSPVNLLEEILADADLDSLGRDDFWIRSQALRDEIAAFGNGITDIEWLQGQFNFLTSHRYFTAEARLLRNAQKHKNVEEIIKHLKDLGVEVKYMFLV